MKEIYSRAAAVVLFCMMAVSSFAQKTVSGVISDTNGPLPGVSILVKGSSRGTTTDAQGRFSIVATPSDVLVFSMIGYAAQEMPVGDQTAIELKLSEDTGQLNEVVVTALGIKRERKSLGYALQEVQGETLNDAKETNVTNALSGRVAGLQVARSSNGPAGSSKIVLRGFNSLTGDNQPLIVVDGVPMDNFIGASDNNNNDFWNPGKDRGNGLGDLNPDDIESMSVLKGGAAAALYGSRAGNGVILITTKTGKAQKGLGISYSSTTGLESIFANPKFQNSFGQGTNGIYDNRSNASWGPKIEGQSVENWDGQTVNMQAYDNVKSYFNTGVNINQNVAFSQQINATSVYSSLTYLNNKSVIPGTKLARTNLITRAVSKFGTDDKWTTDIKIQYINSGANNRPFNGVNSSNAFRTMYLLPRSMDISGFSSAIDENKKMVWYGGGNQINPYWSSQYDLNNDVRDRFLLSGSLKYQIVDWLSAEVRGGGDLYNTNTETMQYSGSPNTATGRYGNGKETFKELNYIGMLNANKDEIWSKMGITASLGAQLMRQKRSSLNANSGELVVPDLFSLNNGINNPTITELFSEKRINSVFGSVGFNWDGYLFLDGTIRNDWTSTLAPENRSFFYPSISTSWVISEMLERAGKTLPSWLTYAKVRASYAQVGNDMNPYQLYNTYTISKDPNGNTNASRKDVLYDPTVKNELIDSWEVGAELKFFGNRLGVDAAFYKSNATHQLIDLPMDPLSGYSSRKINAGDIENKGIELMINGRILDNPDAFSWDMNVNFSRNINTIKDLYQDVTQYRLPGGGFDNLSVLAVKGELYGEIWGTGFARVTDSSSPYFGQLIISDAGLPTATAQAVRLGNQQPTALVGITNSFSFKNLSLSFLIDARFGGKIFSGTNQAMQNAGTALITAPDGERNNMVANGVIYDEEQGTYAPNTIEITPQQYWNAITTTGGNLGINEANIYDASNIRLRNLQLNYSFPTKWLSKTPIQRARIGVSCNNVWLISSHMNGVDPESVFATGTNAVGFENGSAPTSRSYLLNLSIGF